MATNRLRDRIRFHDNEVVATTDPLLLLQRQSYVESRKHGVPARHTCSGIGRQLHILTAGYTLDDWRQVRGDDYYQQTQHLTACEQLAVLLQRVQRYGSR